MTTASEEILARYRRQEVESDAFGRAITVRKLRPSEQVALMRMADTSNAEVVSALTVSACVLKIDDDLFTFPKSIAELNAVMDRLDEEGLTAATAAFVRLQGGGSADGEPKNPTDEAKNSSATSS